MSDTLRERVARAIWNNKVDPGAEWSQLPALGWQDDIDETLMQAEAVLSVLHEAGEQGDGMCPDPECATDHICGDGGCRMNTLLADMGHERWVDAWREAADWRDQYRRERDDAIALLHELWGAVSDAPDELDDRAQAFLIAHPSPAVAGEQDGAESTKQQALRRLAAARDALAAAKAEHDSRISVALVVGCSERQVGRAAGMSGAAINQRKKRRAGEQENNQ